MSCKMFSTLYQIHRNKVYQNESFSFYVTKKMLSANQSEAAAILRTNHVICTNFILSNRISSN